MFVYLYFKQMVLKHFKDIQNMVFKMFNKKALCNRDTQAPDSTFDLQRWAQKSLHLKLALNVTTIDTGL